MKPQLNTNQFIGIILLLGLLVIATLIVLLSPYTIAEQDLSARLMSPSASHWLGTDHFGRDMLTRLASAIQLSFILSFLCVLTSATLGVSLGVLSAWKGGLIAQGMDVIVNILLALPGLVLVLLLAAIAPGSFVVLYLAITLTQWVEYFRVSRVVTNTIINSPARQLSQMMGFGAWYQFRRHIWPELTHSILTLASFAGANAILTMASLGFVYVGIQPPLAELGLMSVELFPYYDQAPWILIQPLIAIATLVFGFHLLSGNKNDSTH